MSLTPIGSPNGSPDPYTSQGDSKRSSELHTSQEETNRGLAEEIAPLDTRTFKDLSYIPGETTTKRILFVVLTILTFPVALFTAIPFAARRAYVLHQVNHALEGKKVEVDVNNTNSNEKISRDEMFEKMFEKQRDFQRATPDQKLQRFAEASKILKSSLTTRHLAPYVDIESTKLYMYKGKYNEANAKLTTLSQNAIKPFQALIQRNQACLLYLEAHDDTNTNIEEKLEKIKKAIELATEHSSELDDHLAKIEDYSLTINTDNPRPLRTKEFLKNLLALRETLSKKQISSTKEQNEPKLADPEEESKYSLSFPSPLATNNTSTSTSASTSSEADTKSSVSEQDEKEQQSPIKKQPPPLPARAPRPAFRAPLSPQPTRSERSDQIASPLRPENPQENYQRYQEIYNKNPNADTAHQLEKAISLYTGSLDNQNKKLTDEIESESTPQPTRINSTDKRLENLNMLRSLTDELQRLRKSHP